MASNTTAWTRLDATAIPLLYTPIERAALAKYLGFKDPAPDELSHVDLSATVDPDEWDQDELGIAPLASETDYDALMLENVVARICLETVQHRLPQWALVSNAKVTLGRRVSRSRTIVRELRPVSLFTINWADSAPGYSWPEEYHVTHLPGYDISVVTASNDSPDANGYCDFAIGWFPGSDRKKKALRECLTSYWFARRCDNQTRWAYLFDTGLIDGETAHAWAREVWK